MPSPNALDLFYGSRTLAGRQAREVILTSPVLSDVDRLSIEAYLNAIRSRGVGGRRLLKIAYTLTNFRKYLAVDYCQCRLIEYQTAIADLHDIGSYSTGKPFAKESLADYVLMTKQYLTWLVENGNGQMDERGLQKVQIPSRGKNTLTHNDILSPEEIIAFLDACTNARDRALFSTMYEGGFRVGEIGTLTWGNLRFDTYGILVNVVFKTDKPRSVRLLSCVRDLSTWKATTKAPTGPNDLVFTQLKQDAPYPVTHGLITKAMRRTAKSAGIEKRIYPHLFRHSRITHMLADGVHESVIKLMMWGDINSEQLKTYAHLSTTNMDRALFDCYGIKQPQIPEPIRYTPVTCSHCSQINPPGARYCSSCGQNLSETDLYSTDALQEYLTQHPELIVDFLTNFQNRGE